MIPARETRAGAFFILWTLTTAAVQPLNFFIFFIFRLIHPSFPFAEH